MSRHVDEVMAAARKAIGVKAGEPAPPDYLLWLAGVKWAADWVDGVIPPLFPDQTCLVCGMTHIGLPCPQPPLFREEDKP